MDDPSWWYETTLVAQPVSAPRARAFVCRHLIEHGVAYLVDPVRLVVSELATHTIVQARGSFTVTLSCTDRTLRLAVRDEEPIARIPSQVRRTELMADAMAAYHGIHKKGLALNKWAVVDALLSFYTVGDCQFDSPDHHGTPEASSRTGPAGRARAARPTGPSAS